MLAQLLPVMILFVFVLLFGGALLFATSLLGPKFKKSKTHQMPYECGVIGEDAGTTKIPIKFYLTAISFILFDIEVVFLYPWTTIFGEHLKDLGTYLIITMGVFVGVLIFGLFYEWKAKALEWD